MTDRDMDIIDEILEDTAEDMAEEILHDSIVEQEAEAEAPAEAEEEAAEESTEETEADEKEETKEKKGFFGKKKEKPDKKDEQIAELTDRLQRSLAEFNNFRNRTEKEKAAMFEIGARNVIEKMLPVVDNFERGLASVPESERENSFAAGMDMIYKQLLKTLNDMGVQEIEALGKEFNPDLHNAVMHVESEEDGENVVVEVFQKGYTYHDIVIRYAMVKVAN